MREKWTLRNLCNLLLVTGVVTCTPIESYGAIQNSQHNHGVVSGIVWRGDQGLQSTLPFGEVTKVNHD
jgi:hypothetical protein